MLDDLKPLNYWLSCQLSNDLRWCTEYAVPQPITCSEAHLCSSADTAFDMAINAAGNQTTTKRKTTSQRGEKANRHMQKPICRLEDEPQRHRWANMLNAQHSGKRKNRHTGMSCQETHPHRPKRIENASKRQNTTLYRRHRGGHACGSRGPAALIGQPRVETREAARPVAPLLGVCRA